MHLRNSVAFLIHHMVDSLFCMLMAIVRVCLFLFPVVFSIQLFSLCLLAGYSYILSAFQGYAIIVSIAQYLFLPLKVQSQLLL